MKKEISENKVRVVAVDYINAKPLIYGLKSKTSQSLIDLDVAHPAKAAQMLINNEADVGLIPAAALIKLEKYHIITDFCIGCDGEVASVCLFSDVPLPEIKTVILDYQSMTSVALLKIIIKEHWKITPVIEQGSAGFESRISGTTAGLIIGDRALVQRNLSGYIYDLGTAWKEMTGLPFVFAVWASTKVLSPDFIQMFNRETARGFDHLEEIVKDENFPDFDLQHYYTKNIDYNLDDRKQKALEKFLNYIR